MDSEFCGKHHGGGTGEENPEGKHRICQYPRAGESVEGEGNGGAGKVHRQLPDGKIPHPPLREGIEQVCKQRCGQKRKHSTEQVIVNVPARNHRPCSGEQCCTGRERHPYSHVFPEHDPLCIAGRRNQCLRFLSAPHQTKTRKKLGYHARFQGFAARISRCAREQVGRYEHPR